MGDGLNLRGLVESEKFVVLSARLWQEGCFELLSHDLSEVDLLGKPAVLSNLFEGFESHFVVFDQHLKEQIFKVLELGAEHLEVGG